MRKIILYYLPFLVPFIASAQDFKLEQLDDGIYEITVVDYESVSNLQTGFNEFYYNTDDKPDGKLIVKNEAGKVVRECQYKNGKMGKEVWWYSTGEQEWEGDWGYANELKSYKRWYRNGQLRSESDTTGLNTQYYEDGAKRSQQQFVNGQPEGPYQKWFRNGAIMVEGQHKDGQPSGIWRYYDPNNNLKQQKDFSEQQPLTPRVQPHTGHD